MGDCGRRHDSVTGSERTGCGTAVLWYYGMTVLLRSLAALSNSVPVQGNNSLPRTSSGPVYMCELISLCLTEAGQHLHHTHHSFIPRSRSGVTASPKDLLLGVSDDDFRHTTVFPCISRLTCFTGGTLDGNGQTWYDLYAADKYILRPVL